MIMSPRESQGYIPPEAEQTIPDSETENQQILQWKETLANKSLEELESELEYTHDAEGRPKLGLVKEIEVLHAEIAKRKQS